MVSFKRLLLAGCALAGVSAANSAWAQQASGANAAEQGSTEIEQVVVTAEKRATNLQDTPIAITAFSDKARDNMGILTIQNMAQFTPGFSYSTSTDRPSIRGITRQSNTFSISSPVANYWDGVYTSSVQDASRRPIFIDRTEILRGPQGALSGKGSIAGAINTISKRPKDHFEAEVGIEAGNYQRAGFEGTVTGPLTDWLNGRINFGKYIQDAGWFTNVATGTREGDQPNNRTIMDFMANGHVTPKFDFFLKAAFADYDETYRSTYNLAPYIAGSDPCNPTWTGGLVPNASFGFFSPGLGCGQVKVVQNTSVVPFNPLGVLAGTGVRQNAVLLTGNVRYFNNNYRSNVSLDNNHNYTSEMVFHAPIADIKYIWGNQQYRYTQLTDGDGVPVISMRLPPPNIGPFTSAEPVRTVDPTIYNLYQEERNWYSHELNLTSTKEGPLQWVVGAFMSHENYNQQPSSQNAPGYAELNTPTGAPANGTEGRFQYGHLFGENDSRAAFGQLDYSPSEHWKFTAGARYNYDKVDVREEVRFILNAADFLANNVNFTTFQLAPTAIDYTSVLAPGFAFGGATSVVPGGYRTIALAPGAGAVTAACPAGQYVTYAGITQCSSAANTLAILSPGIVGDVTVNAVNGNRQRKLSDSWHGLQYTLGADWTPNDDTLVYLRAASGYRPGGFNSGFLVTTPEVNKETVKSYELGSKLTLWNKLQVNTAAFYYDYTQIQQPLATFERCITPTDLSTCTAVTTLVNLPSARNVGFELEATWYPIKNLMLYLSYGYLETKITDGLTPAGFLNGLDPSALINPAKRVQPTSTNPLVVDAVTGLRSYTQDLTGNELSFAPKNKVALNANYTFNLAPGDLTLSASWIWHDKSFSDLFNTPNNITPKGDQTSVRSIFRDKERKYQVVVYVDNLFDQNVSEFASVIRRSAGGAAGPANQVYFPSYDLAPPRTFGIEIQRKFN